MKRTFLSFLFTGVATLAFSQLNMTLTDTVFYPQLTSSLWGYIDPEDSTEYAAVGTRTGVSIVDITDPYNIQQIAFMPDLQSLWREVKSYGHYIYSVTEAGGGVQVINMNDPTNVTQTHWAPTITGIPDAGTLNRIHTITVDEFGFLYLNGTNLNDGGPLIVDVSADDGNPVYVGALPNIYCHDSYARDNKLYTSDINVGNFKVYDVTDHANPVLLATQQTPYNFTHNTWLSDDSQTIFTTDEKMFAPVTSYDISDLDNIEELDQFRPIATSPFGNIPHNVHVWDDWVVVAYYTEGTLIVDGSRPENMIEVGYFDSFVSETEGFFGVWGVYPYFPSGLVAASDMQNGLLIYDVDYVRACWLEGKVTDAATGLPIFEANIDINSPQPDFSNTDLAGEYKTGQALAGVFDVTFSATGYLSKTLPVTFENGVLTILDVELGEPQELPVSGATIRAADGNPVPGAQVLFQSNDNEYTATTDASGAFSIPLVFQGEYTIFAGAWGYFNEAIMNFTLDGPAQPIIIEMDEGYQDDFIVDLGWTATQSSSSGDWTLGEPVGTEFGTGFSNTDFDVDFDLGNKCYVTGNEGGGAGNDDVDNGTVTLTSPPMDLTGYNEPYLKYSAWFFNGSGTGTPNDYLQVRVSNGTDEVVIETFTTPNQFWNTPSEIKLSDFITLTDNVRVIFEAIDQAPGHLVEAAVDAFLIEENLFGTSSGTTGCQPLTVAYEGLPDNVATWLWAFEGGTPATSSDPNPVVVYNTPGTFDVSLTVVTSSGETTTNARPNYVTVNATPSAGFTFNVAGANAGFANTSTGNGTYAWDFGDTGTSTVTSPGHIYTAAGTYTVTLTVTNDCGTSTISQNVTISAIPPTASFVTSTTQGCLPLEVDFTDQSVGAPTAWSWSFPGGTPATSTAQNPTVVYNLAGNFSVQLTVTNAAGNDVAQQNQIIQVGTAPSVLFSFTSDQTEVSFANASSGASSFTWDFGDASLPSSNEENPVVTYPGPGEYEVTLTAENDCGIAVSTQTVVIEANATVDLDGSAFSLAASPNPFADKLVVDYELRASFEKAELLVFNALGEQVASRRLGAAVGSVSLENELAQSGVYFLQLSLDGKTGKALRVVKI